MAQTAAAAPGDRDAHRLLADALTCRTTAPERARSRLEQALDLTDEPRLRHRIGTELLQLLTWREPEAADALARRMLINEHDGQRLAELRFARAHALVALGRADESVAQLEEAMAAEPDPSTRALITSHIALRHVHLGDLGRAEVEAEAVLAAADAGQDARTASACALAMVRLWQVRHDAADGLLDEAAIEARGDERVMAAGPNSYRIVLTAELGSDQDHRSAAALALREVATHDSRAIVAWQHAYGALVRYRALDLHDAMARIEALRGDAEASGVAAHTVLSSGLEALIALDLDEIDHARGAVARGEAHLFRSGLLGRSRLHLAQARLAAEDDEHDVALRIISNSFSSATDAGSRLDAVILAPDLVRTALLAGDQRSVRRVRAAVPDGRGDLLGAVGSWVKALAERDGPAAMTAATALEGNHQWHWATAALADAAGMPGPHAEDARRHAAARYRRGGALGALRRLHIPGQEGPPQLWQLLSVREQQVARLVAEGRTNQQVATALGISRRTVETHVAQALRRTGMVSRVQLAVLAKGQPERRGDRGR